MRTNPSPITTSLQKSRYGGGRSRPSSPMAALQLHTSFLSLSLSKPSPFLHGSAPLTLHARPSPPPLPSLPVIRAMRNMQGRVVCATNDKTVAVEVVRLAPHPKYKRRVRKKKKYQAHDPENRFKVGDFVQLQKSRPISKTKAFVALPTVAARSPKAAESAPEELGIPLQSQAQL